MNESSHAPLSVTQDLFPVAGASLAARNIVTETCLRWNVPHVVGSAALIVSELVGNAVDHAHTMMTLQLDLRHPDLRLSVQDGSAAPPVLRRDNSSAAQRGRGLLLVEAVSTTWGYQVDEGGKTVWATIDVTADPGPFR